ncbi:hypothetical protein ACNS7O_14390 [Haloferacaceae archaeon DSL9]
MSLVSSLPSRPLSEAETTTLNRSDRLTLAIAVDGERPGTGLLLATDDWVKGLTFEDGWRVVATASLDGTERYEALQRCESAVRATGE